MKAILVLVLVIFMFFACAILGYYAASAQGGQADETQQQPTAGGNFEEHRLLVVQVDQLDAPRPQLVSVWYVSLYFVQDASPTLTFGQLYGPEASRESARSLAKSFALDRNGDPTNAFWKAVSAFGVQWEAFFMVDQPAVQYIMQWLHGPGEYASILGGTEETRALVQQSCETLGGLAAREMPPFDWTVIAPSHFRSNIRMEHAMDYWNEIVKNPHSPRCDVILAP